MGIMNDMKRTIFLTMLAIVWLVTPVQAVEPGMTNARSEIRLQKTQLHATRSATLANREEIKQKQCDLIENRINFRLSQSEQNRDKQYNIFQGVRKRIAALITKFGNRSCDVASLKTNLTTFDILIANFSSAFREFTTSMQATREYRCSESEGKFATATQASRGKSLALREASQAVHTFFKNTIQPELSSKAKECQPSPKPSAKPSPKPSASPTVEGEQ
jgi:bisphosphoglycerate-dependent phosphoglycerate mutase